eukprot:NODE_496_length_6811_cov_0.672378.p2 type:complete len:390 gc:universal NODE_496_length_6811_cov_0.672378:5497-6666(+)
MSGTQIYKIFFTVSSSASISWLLISNTPFKHYFEGNEVIYDYMLYTEQMTTRLAGFDIEAPKLIGLEPELNILQNNLKNSSRFQDSLKNFNEKFKLMKLHSRGDKQYIRKLEADLSGETKKYENDLMELRHNLEEAHRESNLKIITEKEKQLKSQYEKLLSAQNQHLKDQFKREVSELVETEREGKLQKLNNLEEELTELKYATIKVQEENSRMKNSVDLYNSIILLKNRMAKENTSIDLNTPGDPFINSIIAHMPKYVRSENEIQAKFINMYPQLLKTSLLNSNESLLNKATNFINGWTGWSLSNEQEKYPRMTFWRYFTTSVLSKFVFPWQTKLDELLLKVKQRNFKDSATLCSDLPFWPKKLLSEWHRDVADHEKVKELILVLETN